MVRVRSLIMPQSGCATSVMTPPMPMIEPICVSFKPCSLSHVFLSFSKMISFLQHRRTNEQFCYFNICEKSWADKIPVGSYGFFFAGRRVSCID